MKWIKKGLIYGPQGEYSWAKHSALQPTPIIINNKIIRVYVGFRDEQGVSRIGYVDVDADNPSNVLQVSKEPVLDVGVNGTFDDNGVVPTAIMRRNGKYFLYYAGYQIPYKIKFLVFGGLAVSQDGEKFTRYKQIPVMDRTEKELYFRVPHSIIHENGTWKVWYGSGSQFTKDGEKLLPMYDVKYTESDDGINFTKPGQVCIKLAGEEYRIGRPYVVRDKETYKMFYGVATKSKGYRIGYAESKNGIEWERKDSEVGIDISKTGWDSKMIAYPAIMKWGNETYMFYNGNDMGQAGFGYAVLKE